jgi:hypothetical protein
VLILCPTFYAYFLSSPTDPTQSPTVAAIPEQPSNHMFCASDVTKVAESCELIKGQYM